MALGEIYNLRSDQQRLKRAGFGLEQKTHIIGRKRVVVSSLARGSCFASPTCAKAAKRCHRRPQMEGSNHLEALPQDILVRILCKVNHGDLRRLLCVSKSVREATWIAKELHFAYSTPSKSLVDVGGEARDSEPEGGTQTPDAPKQQRVAKSRLDSKKLAAIAVALFASPENN